MSAVVSLQNVWKRYGRVTALRGISFDLQGGEILGILGQDGAGKSTVLKLLTGLVWPSSGNVQLFGKELRGSFTETAARFGALIGEPAFYDHLTVRRNLLIQGRLAGKPVSVNRVLDWVDLVDVAHERVESLAPGMRRRLALAQALLTEPELLLLDEPFLGLDIEATQRSMELLRSLSASAGVSIIFGTHMLYEAETLSDRVVVLHEGQLAVSEESEALQAYVPDQVEVLLEGAESAGRKLAEQPWIEHVDVRPGRLIVRLREKSAHHLNSYLVQSGYRVSGLFPRRRTLQDYLLKVMNQ